MKTGDVVKLKSGGPDMTITKRYTGVSEDAVECTWFDKSGGINSSKFPDLALQPRY